MTLIQPTPARRTLVSLVVVLLATVWTASAAAATAAPPAPAPAASAAAVANATSAPAAAADTATPASAGPAQTPAGPVTAGVPAPSGSPASGSPQPAAPAPAATQGPGPSATPPAPPPPVGDDIQAQPAIISAGSNAPIGRPTRDSPGVASQRLSDRSIVSTSHRFLAPAPRPTLTQLASGGPFVAASGTAASGTPARVTPPAPVAPGRAPVSRRGAPSSIGPWATATGPQRLTAAMMVSVPLVDVYIGNGPNTHRPEAKAPSPLVQPVGPAGLSSTTLTPFAPGSVPQPGGGPGLFGNAPFSSSSGSAPLLGLNAMLAAVTLLAGLAWRRRSWDLPVLQGESALLSSALDRPG